MVGINKTKVCDIIYNCNPKDVNGVVRPVVNYDIRVLTSGMLSDIFLDNRIELHSHKDRSGVVDELAYIAKKNNADYIISSFDAAVPWGILVADNLGLGFAGVRKKKEGEKYGKVMGVIPEDVERPFNVEDLNTTGKTILHVIDSVANYGIKIKKGTAIVDKQEYTPKNKARLDELRFQMSPVLTISDLSNHGLKNEWITVDKVAEIKNCRENNDDFAIKVIQEKPDWIKNHERLDRVKEFYAEKPEVRKVLEDVIGPYS